MRVPDTLHQRRPLHFGSGSHRSQQRQAPHPVAENCAVVWLRGSPPSSCTHIHSASNSSFDSLWQMHSWPLPCILRAMPDRVASSGLMIVPNLTAHGQRLLTACRHAQTDHWMASLAPPILLSMCDAARKQTMETGVEKLRSAWRPLTNIEQLCCPRVYHPPLMSHSQKHKPKISRTKHCWTRSGRCTASSFDGSSSKWRPPVRITYGLETSVHLPEMVHHFQGISVRHEDIIHIHSRDCEAGSKQQVPSIADLGSTHCTHVRASTTAWVLGSSWCKASAADCAASSKTRVILLRHTTWPMDLQIFERLNFVSLWKAFQFH